MVTLKLTTFCQVTAKLLRYLDLPCRLLYQNHSFSLSHQAKTFRSLRGAIKRRSKWMNQLGRPPFVNLTEVYYRRTKLCRKLEQMNHNQSSLSSDTDATPRKADWLDLEAWFYQVSCVARKGSRFMKKVACWKCAVEWRRLCLRSWIRGYSCFRSMFKATAERKNVLR